MRGGRSGRTLLEVLVALVVGLALLQLAMSGLVTAKRVEADVRSRSDRLAVVRAARVTLRRALGAGVEGRDWTAHPPDSVVVRAFQGVALPCPLALPDAETLVRWSGRRLPDASEDSVLVLGARGDWTAHRLVASEATALPCTDDPTDVVRRWELDPRPQVEAVLYRVYESASYHVADGALRYRIGGGGRQPLTPDVLDRREGGGFLFEPGLAVRLRGANGAWAWRALLAARR